MESDPSCSTQTDNENQTWSSVVEMGDAVQSNVAGVEMENAADGDDALYLECEDDGAGSHRLTVHSLTAVFLSEYCRYRKHATIFLGCRKKGQHRHYQTLLNSPVTVTPASVSHSPNDAITEQSFPEGIQGNRIHPSQKADPPSHLLQVPECLKACCIQQVECLPRVVQDCQLPCIVLSGGQMCVSGLANVLRHIVQVCAPRQAPRNLEALLGFRQTCLKGCAETSVWTKLCEVDTPDQVLDYMLEGRACDGPEKPRKWTCPPSLGKFQELMAQPVSTFNSEKLRRKLLKSRKREDDQQKTSRDEQKTAGTVGRVRGSDPKAVGAEGPGLVGGREGGDRIDGESKSPMVNGESECSDGKLHSEFKTTLHIGNKKEIRRQKREKRAKDALAKSNSDGIVLYSLEPGTEKIATQESNHHVKKMSSVPNENVEEDPPGNSDKGGRTRGRRRNKEPVHKNSLPKLTRIYTQGVDVTLADFALFVPIHLYIHTCQENGMIQDAARTVPSVLQWYTSMWNVPFVRQVVSDCLAFTEIDLPVMGNDDSVEEKPKTESHLSEEDIQPGVGNLAVSRSVVRELLRKSLPGVMSSLGVQGISVAFEDHLAGNTAVDWRGMPAAVSPLEGELDARRAAAKEQQIENMLAAVRNVARPGNIILDFCSGGGHLGIAIAYCLPDCHVIMIENKEESLRRALERVQTLGLSNVTLYLSNIDYFYGMFDIGVSLHACGVATDIVLSKCMEQGASFVSSPCCYGSLHDTHHMTYPRSRLFQESTISKKDYFLLGHGAEQTSRNFDSPLAVQGKKCMGFVDLDRAELARERGYLVTLCSLHPQTCSPKNNLLVGVSPKHLRSEQG